MPEQSLQIGLQRFANDHFLVVLHWFEVLLIRLDETLDLVGDFGLKVVAFFIKASGKMPKQGELEGENILAWRELPALKGVQSEFMAIKLVFAMINISLGSRMTAAFPIGLGDGASFLPPALFLAGDAHENDGPGKPRLADVQVDVS